MRYKYLDFKIPDSLWKKNQPFIAIPADTKDRKARSLMRWHPNLYKAEWRIRITNSHTRETKSHKLIKVEAVDGWLIAFWNPNEVLDAILDTLPTVMATSLVVGALASIQNRTGEIGREQDGTNTYKTG